MKPRLWIVSELYYPEETSTGYFLTRIGEGLAAENEVHAVCARPTYSERDVPVAWGETRNGVVIHRTLSTRFAKDAPLGRLCNLVTFTVAACFLCAARFRRGDRVLVVTNPPSVPPLIAMIAWIKGCKSVLLIHDVYPEVLVATGHVRAGGLVDRLLGALIRATYAAFDQIVVLGRDMAELAAAKLGKRDERILVIPNWGDVDEIVPLDRETNPFIRINNTPGSTILQFSGNLGRTHNIETVLEAARLVADDPRIVFQFVGGGGKDGVVAQAAERSNIQALKRQPRYSLNAMLSAGDCAIIGFVDGMLGVSVPSRMYNLMAAGTPIVAMANPRSELAMVVSEEECGWVLAPDDADGLASLARFLTTPDGKVEARRRGAKGRSAAEARYSFPVACSKYLRIFSESTGT